VLALSAVAGSCLFRWLDRKRKYTLASKGGASVARYGRASADTHQHCRRDDRDRAGSAHLMVVLVPSRDGAWTTQVPASRVYVRELPAALHRSELWRPITTRVDGARRYRGQSRSVFSCAYLSYSGNSRAGSARVLVLFRGRFRRRRSRLAWRRRSTETTCISPLLLVERRILPLAYFIRDIPLVASAVEGPCDRWTLRSKTLPAGLAPAGF